MKTVDINHGYDQVIIGRKCGKNLWGRNMKTVDIPIDAAKKIALDYGYDQVIIIGRKVGVGGREHCTTYGVNKKHCSVAAKSGDFLKYKIMGWVKEEL